MMTFPGLDDAELSEGALAVKKHLAQVDLMEGRAALQNSLAGKIGSALEGITHFDGFDWRTCIQQFSVKV